MRVTRFTDIGMRVLIYLSRERRESPTVTVAEIASQFDIPANHVVKVAGRLAKMGVIATRGRHGGVKLSDTAGGVGVGRLLRALEGDDELIDCDGLACRLRGNCVLRGALQEGLDAFYAAMDRYTLADVAGGPTGEQIIRMHRSFVASRDTVASASAAMD
jgi:Rrf2 family nitric oxide-sensitive transcriptional repressor